MSSGGLTAAELYRLYYALRGLRGPIPRATAWLVARQFAHTLGGDPDWYCWLLAFESRWDTKAINLLVERSAPGTGASGLIQFVGSTAKRLGLTLGAIRAMDAADQVALTWLYLSERAPYRSEGDLYLAVFLPRGIGRPLTTPLTEAERRYNPGIATTGDYVRLIREKGASIWASLT